MQLTKSGTIKTDGCNVLRTEDGGWMVSRNGTLVGYVDMLDEVPGLITRQREAVRARLADVQRKAQERKDGLRRTG